MIKQTCNQNMIPTSDNRLELDTAATMFPLAFCDSHKSLIRLTVTMNENVDNGDLQRALNRLITRFPSFYVRLSHDQFRYFFEKLDYAPIISEDVEANEPLHMTLDDLKQVCVPNLFNRKPYRPRIFPCDIGWIWGQRIFKIADCRIFVYPIRSICSLLFGYS